MFISMLRSKLHQARVTGADLNYVGSIGIDSALLERAGMHPYERVLVVNLENGARFETYIIPEEAGSGAIRLNGAAARLANVGDRLIIMAFTLVEPPPPADWSPRVVALDEHNRPLPQGTGN
ncbi:MAG TPA: aspartate 1-decarboxylase [Chloroflexi bacterium]|nr:aspartate 1-decarboxylase [Chloroflexota bacterium]